MLSAPYEVRSSSCTRAVVSPPGHRIRLPYGRSAAAVRVFPSFDYAPKIGKAEGASIVAVFYRVATRSRQAYHDSGSTPLSLSEIADASRSPAIRRRSPPAHASTCTASGNCEHYSRFVTCHTWRNAPIAHQQPVAWRNSVRAGTMGKISLALCCRREPRTPKPIPASRPLCPSAPVMVGQRGGNTLRGFDGPTACHARYVSSFLHRLLPRNTPLRK